jgi:hypothetical protein
MLADFETDEVFYYHPQKTVICLELAPGLQRTQFSHNLFYPTHENIVSAESFQYEPISLQRGMGPEYDAVLYGSLTAAQAASCLPPSNAYDRLCYVVQVLKVLHDRGGSFPFGDIDYTVGKSNIEL